MAGILLPHFFVFSSFFLGGGVFVWSLSSHSKIFLSFGDVTIAGEGLQILTYAQNLWPLSSVGS